MCTSILVWIATLGMLRLARLGLSNVHCTVYITHGLYQICFLLRIALNIPIVLVASLCIIMFNNALSSHLGRCCTL